MLYKISLFSLIAILLSACGGGSSDGATAQTEDPVDAAVKCQSNSLIETRTLADGKKVELWRLKNPEGGCSYMAFVPHPEASAGSPLPVVIYTMPYAGIDWTGEPVDERWAQQAMSGGGNYPDQDQPDYTEGSSDIGYTPHSLGNLKATIDITHINRVSAAYAFGRFYAGGNIDNDVGDVVAAIDTISERADVDANNVAVTGGSWGGFQAVYGAAYAEHVPKVTVALYPAINLLTLSSWAGGVVQSLDPSRANQFSQFYEPYLRRIKNAVGNTLSEETLGRYNGQELCDRLNQTLIFHDTWDMIIPHQSSLDYSERCPSATLISLAHLTPLDPASASFDHGKQTPEYGMPIIDPLRYDTIFRAFDIAPRTIPYGPESLRGYLTVLRYLPDDQAYARKNMHAALLGLMDESVYLFDANGSEVHGNGADILLEAYNNVWGAELTEEELRSILESDF